MATHLHTGKLGESMGAAYLRQRGYVIRVQNWRHGHWEVDLIAEKDNVLHFVEIKTRRSKRFGLPEDKVGKKKIENLINAAEAYLLLYPEWQRIQFNILAVLLLKNEPAAFLLIEDVYL